MGRVPADLATAIALGGEMGERIAEFDWGGHPLGPLESWPPRMRAIVAATLASRFPTVLWCGPELYLLYNDAYRSVLGEKHPAALGAAGRDAWWEIWDIIGPMLNGVMETGMATWNADQHFDVRRHGFSEEGFFTFTYSPMFGESGEVTGVFCAVHETTEKVFAERRLRTLSDLSARLAERHDPRSVADTALNVCSANASDLPFVGLFLAGGDSTSFYGATGPAADFLAVNAASLKEACDPAGDRERTVLVEDLETHIPGLAEALGEAGPVAALSMPLDDGSGSQSFGSIVVGLNPRIRLEGPYRSFCELVASNVTRAFSSARLYGLERERAETLAELDRAKSILFSNISHEFRTPLTLILSPLEDALADDDTLTPAQRERLTVARANARRMSKLVNNLLDFTRLEAGGARPHLTRVDAAALTGDLVEMFRTAFERAGVRLETDLTLDEPLDLDPEMWERIVLNLVSNALKYTLSGSVRVSLKAEGKFAQLVVADTGVGIPADEQELVFTRFQRAERGGRSIEGSGIGLAIVRELVRILGGEISLESQPGVGSSFSVSVPLASSDEATPVARPTRGPSALLDSQLFVEEAMQWLDSDAHLAALPPLSGAPGPGREDGTVLVVDDNPDMRRYLERVLGQIWRVELAGNGNEALEIVSRRPPDLILSDVMMPELDGVDLIAELRKNPASSEIPVILVSARAGAEASVEGLQAGAEDYIVKPFSSRDLVGRVRARLAASGRRSARTEEARQGERLRGALAELSGELAAVTTPERLAEAVLLTLSKVSRPSFVCVARLGEGAFLELWFAGSAGGGLRTRWRRVALSADMPVAAAAREQIPLLFADRATLRERFLGMSADAASLPSGGFAALPLVRDGQTIGSLAIAWEEAVEFDVELTEFIDSIVDLTARAMERLRMLEFERSLTETLQLELLALPIRSRTAVISANYSPSLEMLGVGGDWFDAFELPDGKLGLAVGDVVGHGIQAAAVMGQLRSALAVSALQGGGASETIEALDQFASRLPGAAMTTVAYAVIDPNRSVVSYSCAGHPPPVLVTPDGRVQYLTEGRSGALANADEPEARAAASVPFSDGSLLFLYTDGLVERRGESIDRGLARLFETLSECWSLPVRALTAHVLEHQELASPFGDDIAIITARTPAATSTVYGDILPADKFGLAGMRHGLREWLKSIGCTRDERDDVVLAVSEAATNAIEHGSGGNRAEVVSLEAAVTGGELLLAVSDNGSWRPNALESFRTGRGNGHRLMEALTDELEITTDRYGTTVTLVKRTTVGAAR